MYKSKGEFREFYIKDLKKQRLEIYFLGAFGGVVTLLDILLFIKHIRNHKPVAATITFLSIMICFYIYYRWFPKIIKCYKGIKNSYIEIENLYYNEAREDKTYEKL